MWSANGHTYGRWLNRDQVATVYWWRRCGRAVWAVSSRRDPGRAYAVLAVTVLLGWIVSLTLPRFLFR